MLNKCLWKNGHNKWTSCPVFSKSVVYRHFLNHLVLVLYTKKSCTTLKLKVMLCLAGIFRTSSPGGSISNNPERIVPKRWGETKIYRSFATKGGSLNIKRLLLIKENEICQVKEFDAFLCIGRYKSLDTEIIPLKCTSAIWGQGPVFSYLEFPWGLPWGVAAICSLSPSWVPSGLTSSPQLMATITDDCDILCYRQYSIFQYAYRRLLRAIPDLLN